MTSVSLLTFMHWRRKWQGTLESPLNSKEINQSILEEVNPEYSLERPDAETESAIPWPPHAKSQLIREDLDARKDFR